MAEEHQIAANQTAHSTFNRIEVIDSKSIAAKNGHVRTPLNRPTGESNSK